jgi:hypothetical protein
MYVDEEEVLKRLFSRRILRNAGGSNWLLCLLFDLEDVITDCNREQSAWQVWWSLGCGLLSLPVGSFCHLPFMQIGV